MAGNSAIIPLSELCTRITKGTTPTTLGRPFVDRGVTFVKSEAITDDGRIDTSKFAFIDVDTHEALERSILQEGDVLFSMAGVYLGKTAVVPREILPANTNQAVGIIRLDQTKAIPRFIHYVLSSPNCRALVHRSVAQSAQPKFNLRDIGSLRVPALRVPEQRAIAHILGTLDDKIELNRQMNETLEAMVRALFKSWFVDFGPVRAKMEGRWKKGQSLPGLPAHLYNLFPDRLEDSELGEIPAGWRASRLGKEVVTVLGGTPSRAEPTYWGGDVPWINSGKANEFRVVEPSEYITRQGLESSATKILPPRTTVIAITGATLGQVSLTEIETCANQSIVGVVGNSDLPSEFIYFWVKGHIAELLAWQTGGAQ